MHRNDPVIRDRLEYLKRNEKIRSDYDKMKEKGIKVTKIWVILSEKYFTSLENIKKILYKLNGS